MEIQQPLILDRLSTYDLERRLGQLETAYYITEDRQLRQQMLLLMDELKLELNNRGIPWKNL